MSYPNNLPLLQNLGLIAIVSFGIELNGVPTSHLTKLTASDAIINTPVVLTPGGAFGRNVILNR